MQMQGAYEGASIDTIFRINQSLKEQDIYLGTNAEGRNFYDVDASTHPDFHKLTPDEKVDYTNKWAKIEAMPTATAEERAARIKASSEITQDIAKRAAASPANQSRIATLVDAAESQSPGLGKEVPELFVPGQPKDVEVVTDVRKAISAFDFSKATATLNRNVFANRLILPAVGFTAFGALSDIGSVQAAVTTPRTDDMAQTERDISGLSGVAGLAALAPALAPVAAPMPIGFSGAAAGISFRRQREKELERTRQIMDPEYRVSMPDDAVVTRTKPRLPTSFTGRL